MSLKRRNGRVGEVAQKQIECDELPHVSNVWPTPRYRHNPVAVHFFVAWKIHRFLDVFLQRLDRSAKCSFIQFKTLRILKYKCNQIDFKILEILFKNFDNVASF